MSNSLTSILRLGKKYFWRKSLQPEYVIFLATSKCNLRCQHCFLWQGNTCDNTQMGKNDLKLEEIKKISQSMENFFFLNMGGGEPFIRQDLPQIAEVFYKNNHIQNLLIPTNGTLTKAVINSTRKILETCPNLKLSVDVSIDGIGKLHNHIRQGKNTFRKAEITIKALLKLKKKYPNLQVGTITTDMKQNQRHLKEIYRYIKKNFKPDSITYALTRGTPRKPQSKEVDLKYYKEIVSIMEKDFRENKVSGFRKIILWPLVIATKILMHQLVIKTYEKGYQLPCFAGRLNVVIYSNGDVYPCEMLTKDKLGNLRKVNFNFQKLWQSKKNKVFVKRILKTNCFCTHECHLPVNILYSPKCLPKLLWFSFKLILSDM